MTDSDMRAKNVADDADIDSASLWLPELIANLRARWFVVAGGAVAAVLIALLYLWTATYNYSAALRVSSAQSASHRGGLGSLGSLAAIAGVGGIAEEAATPFKLYLEGLKSRHVATRLATDKALMQVIFAREWDVSGQRWHQPSSVSRSLKNGVFHLLGLPVYLWVAPNAARLEEFLGKAITIDQNVKTPLVTIMIDSPDPAFALRFLSALHNADDGLVRDGSRARTEANIAYLSAKLNTVSLAEYRKVLFDSIAEQEQQMMLVNNATPFAAEPFGPPTVSLVPTSPKPIPTLIVALIAGLIAGAVVAVLLGRRPRQGL